MWARWSRAAASTGGRTSGCLQENSIDECFCGGGVKWDEGRGIGEM